MKGLPNTALSPLKAACLGASGFCLGALVGLLALLLIHNGWIGLPLGMLMPGIFGVAALSRLIQGTRLRLWVVFGLAFGFVLSSFPLSLSMLLAWALSWLALPLAIVGCACGFAVAGYLGGGYTNLGEAFARRSARAFAIGGAVGAPFLLFGLYPERGPVSAERIAGSVAAGLLPFALSGALFGKALAETIQRGSKQADPGATIPTTDPRRHLCEEK